jgi:hypothetical protein
MLMGPPNWSGLFLALAMLALVLAVAPFVTPRGQARSQDQVAICDRTMFC